MRLLAVESCGAFAAALSKEDCASSLLPVVQKFAQVRAVGAFGGLHPWPRVTTDTRA